VLVLGAASATAAKIRGRAAVARDGMPPAAARPVTWTALPTAAALLAVPAARPRARRFVYAALLTCRTTGIAAHLLGRALLVLAHTRVEVEHLAFGAVDAAKLATARVEAAAALRAAPDAAERRCETLQAVRTAEVVAARRDAAVLVLAAAEGSRPGADSLRRTARIRAFAGRAIEHLLVGTAHAAPVAARLVFRAAGGATQLALGAVRRCGAALVTGSIALGGVADAPTTCLARREDRGAPVGALIVVGAGALWQRRGQQAAQQGGAQAAQQPAP
jgi:hypothetical protein